MLLLRNNLLKERITKLEEWGVEDALGIPLSGLLGYIALLRDPLLAAFCWVSETNPLNPGSAS